MKKITERSAALFLSIFALLSSGCTHSRSRRYQAEFLLLFDTVTTIVGYSDSEESFNAIAQEARALIEEYHRLYDIYNDYEGINNIKTINDKAGIAPVKVDKKIVDMLTFAVSESRTTGGAVNVAMGAVLSIWHDYRDAGLENPEGATLPPTEKLAEAALHTNIDDMIIDVAASTVYLADPLMRLDVGAVAKGYATEMVARHFEEAGVTSLLISIGGNVRAIGGKPSGSGGRVESWAIGVQNPDKSSARSELMLLNINGLSVVTSGISERYYTVDGVNYHHIINHETLMPSSYFAQVTIICRHSGEGDSLSTALFNMPLDRGREYVESLADVEAVWIMHDGRIEYSSGFEEFIRADK